MKPLVDITKAIGVERWVTISVVRPLLHKLLEVYFKPEESDEITRLEKVMKIPCTQTFHEHTQDLNMATFMDPRFKGLPLLSDDDHLNVVGSVEAEAVMLAVNNSTPNEIELSTSSEIELLDEPDLPLSKLVRQKNICFLL